MLFEQIKELCKQSDITITELERILNFGNGTIHKWDSAQPSISKVQMVAEYFMVSIDMLFGNLNIPSKESRDIAYIIDELNDEQKNLVRCYISLIKNK